MKITLPLLLILFLNACTTFKSTDFKRKWFALKEGDRSPTQGRMERNDREIKIYDVNDNLIVEGEWEDVAVLTDNKILVEYHDKDLIGLYDVKQKKIINTYPGAKLWTYHVDGHPVIFSVNRNNLYPSYKSKPELTFYPPFSNEILKINVGGPELENYRLSQMPQIHPFLFPAVVIYPKFISLNFIENGKAWSMVLDPNLSVIHQKIGMVEHRWTARKETIHKVKTQRNLVLEMTTELGPVEDKSFGSKRYLPLENTGHLKVLPEGISSIAPLQSYTSSNMGWVLLPSDTHQKGFLHMGELDQLPQNLASLPQTDMAYYYLHQIDVNNAYETVLYRSGINTWHVEASSRGPELSQLFPGPVSYDKNDFGNYIYKIVSDDYYRKNPGRLAEKQAYDLAMQRKAQAELDYQQRSQRYPEIKAAGTLCQNFDIAYAAGKTAMDDFLRSCKLQSRDQIVKAQTAGADKNLLAKAISQLSQEENFKSVTDYANTKAAENARKGRTPVNPPSGYVSGDPNAAKKSPSQNLSQQERYDYEKKLRKQINRK